MHPLPGQLLRLFSPMVAHHIRPEFDHFTAYNCLGGDGKTTFECLADRTIRCGVVQIGNGCTHQIAQDVCIVRSPGAVIALAPHRSAGRPQSTAGEAACALLEVTRIFAKQACQHSVTQEIAGKVVGVTRTPSLGVPFHTLTVFGKAVFSLIDARPNGREHEGPRVAGALEKELVLLLVLNGSASLLFVVLKVAITPNTR